MKHPEWSPGKPVSNGKVRRSHKKKNTNAPAILDVAEEFDPSQALPSVEKLEEMLAAAKRRVRKLTVFLRAAEELRSVDDDTVIGDHGARDVDEFRGPVDVDEEDDLALSESRA
jgi:hypothetical protein